ncbi:MAG: NADH dehydrogenase (quinone) subunit D [Candidatus Sericytochromatia bacterium]|nr:NADH dehydrogenase (quinone) subunit D [Candidatus Sericytochromatia bacterium]
MKVLSLENKPSVVPAGEEPQTYQDLHTELMFLNLGPSHPASHGTLRTFVALDGESIAAAVTEIGYLHRGFEKTCEVRTYNQVIPYTDRLNYCSAILNNIGFAKAVERMLDIEITDRCKFLRVIVGELMRVVDHCICIGTNLVDIGALTNFWYLFNKREEVYTVLEKLTGARLTNSFTRIGGLYRDAYDGFEADVLELCKGLEQAATEVHGLIAKNRIFVDRTQGICILTPERAMSYGFTGPNLRACGVPYDIRKTHPYYYYDTFDWDIALGSTGDTYDRIMIRFIEIEQSIRIIRQAVKQLPGGPVNVDDKRVTLPPKTDTYQNIEGLINHFKLVFEGVKVPPGEIYDATEAGNGELGFHIVSDGSGYPYRIKCRPPCFYAFNAFHEMVEGHLIADAVATLGSINIIAGELER